MNHVNATVNSQVADNLLLPITTESNSCIADLVKKVINNQKQDRYYDYASHEQLEIDRLVYEAYSLNDEDIKEVETWYARRYPKLAEAQRKNLEQVRQQER